MKDLEKIFSDKLKHHEVVPPPGPWDMLAQQLRHQRRKRRAVYASVAAACLLFVLLGIRFLDRNEPPGMASSVPSINATDSSRDTDKTTDGQVVKDEVRLDTLDAVDNYPPVEVATVIRQPTNSSVVVDPPEVPSLAVPATLAEATEETVVNVKETKQATASPRTLVVDASRYRKVRDSIPAASPSVTVVYQPNPATLAQEESLGRKVTQALTQIKASKVSLGELRSAKDDLVDKVLFDRESDESPPQ